MINLLVCSGEETYKGNAIYPSEQGAHEPRRIISGLKLEF